MRSLAFQFFTIGSIFLLTSCQNQVDNSFAPSDDGTPSDTAALSGKFQGFACEAGVEANPDPAVRKLTKLEISSRLENLVKRPHSNSSLASQMWVRLTDTSQILSLIPDERQGQYDRMTPALAYGQSMLEGLYSITSEIARVVSLGTTESNNWRSSFLGACGLNAMPTENCLRDFANRLLAAIAPGQTNVALINAAVQAMQANLVEDTTNPKRGWVQIALVSILMSAQGVYRTEFGTSAQSGWKPLTDHELVTRLASVFWMSVPDQTLLTLANAGQVRANYESVLNHIFSDSRFETTMSRFAEQYLRLENTTTVNFQSSNAVIDRVAAYGLQGLGLSAQYTAEAKEEARRFFVELMKRDAPLKSLFLSDASFAQGTLAAAQGVSPWVAGQEPQRYPGGKYGLFTMTAFHLGNGTSKNHIHVAYTLFKNILCQQTPSPESAGVNPQQLVIPPPVGLQTSRERTEALVSPAQCAGCHSQFDYLGFGFSRIDPWGIDRSLERIYDPGTGAHLGNKEPSTAVSFALGGTSRAWNASRDLAEDLVDSEYPQACFARQFYRFSFGREEVEGGELGCALQNFLDSLKRDDLSLKESLKNFARAKIFTERYVGGNP